MFDYYCPSCNKMCNFDEEIEIQEYMYEGDYIEIHVICGTPVQVLFKLTKIEDE